MKKVLTLPRTLVMTLFLLCVSYVYADMANTQKEVMHAVGVLKGIYAACSKEQAVNILKTAAINDSSAYAMNALGLIYMEGIGVKNNYEDAIYWLNEAGKHGYIDAYHNIGAIYKLGKCGVQQDFKEAYKAFVAGAELGSVVCKYDAGYMLFKGLGCEQDYGKALSLFEYASNKEHDASIYMLGLCYRNGYGTEKNEDIGMQLLSKAADLGYRPAIEEIARPKPENCMHTTYMSNENYENIPSSMPQIKPEINDTTVLTGEYGGYIVMYDWSGKFILGEKPILMSINRRYNEAIGNVVLGNDSIPFVANVMADGSLKFKKSYTLLSERYTPNDKVRYSLNYANLDIWHNKILGNLSLYSLKEREPEKPMYIELYRRYSEKSKKNILEQYSQITISPNPFTTKIHASFELQEKAETKIRIYDKFGIMVWQKDIGIMDAGENEITINPLLDTGYYVLNISAGKQVLRTIIVKKGGE